MKTLLVPFGIAVALASAALAADAEGGTVTIRQAMQHDINDATMAIWDVGNSAMGDNGGIDPKLVDDAGWTKLADAADRLAAEAHKMEQAKVLRAATPDEAKDVELGSFSLEDVQGYIDADPQAFRDFAAVLANHAEQIGEAARKHDAATAGPLVDQLDSVCEQCHAKYWYPQG